MKRAHPRMVSRVLICTDDSRCPEPARELPEGSRSALEARLNWRKKGDKMKKLFLLFTSMLLLLALPLGAQTPTSQQIKVFVTAYSINAAAIATFQGCTIGDTGCSTQMGICDETGSCHYYRAGNHVFTFYFVRNGGTEAGSTTAVANANIQIAVQ